MSYKYKVKLLLYFILIIIFVAHFSLTILFVLPPNPIKTTIKLPSIYIGKYFYQDWGLFAPDPISMDISVLVKCVDNNESETPFWNITDDFNRYNNRKNRIQRVVVNYAHSYINASREEMPLLKLCNINPDHASCAQLRKAENDRREASKEGLRRVASAFCADIQHATNIEYEKAHILIELSKVPPWSKRYTESPTKSFLNLGIVALDKKPAFRIWKAEGDALATNYTT